MIKYKNTRAQPVRLQTSTGTVILEGLNTLELSEDITALPYFVEKSIVKEKIVPKKAIPKKSVPAVEEPKSAKKE
jgi:hypothetical protein